MLIKICGLTTPDTLAAADEAGADMVGLVFYPPSPRALTPQQAAALLTRRPKAQVVALTVDAEDALLDTIFNTVKPDIWQLHGNETPGQAAAIKARYGLPVIKALAVRTHDDLGRAHDDYADSADTLLLDAPAPQGTLVPGGNAVTFDWSLLHGWQSPLPWLLAGGLTPDNVADAVRTARPDGVDVSSGVEKARGSKDAALIRKFIANARTAQAKTGA